jgi:uncharacterized membrane protein
MFGGFGFHNMMFYAGRGLGEFFFFILIIVAIVLLVRASNRRKDFIMRKMNEMNNTKTNHSAARTLLDERYVKGEISDEEYKAKKENLK